MSKSERLNIVLKTVMCLALANAVMSGMQIIIGLYSHSDALVADGMHTLLDLCMDGITYVACRLANRPPDKHLAYGYKRVETLACLVLALLLSVVGLGVMYESMVIRDAHQVQSEYVIAVATLTMLMNELLYRYAHTKAQTVHSDLLKASASHQRSDALSSLIVLMSAVIDLTVPGWHVDQMAAFLIGAFILKMGLKIAYRGVFELVDGGIDPKRHEQLTRFMLSNPGVQGIHCMRTRKQAGEICVDAHIITQPFISVSEGHFVGEKLRRRIMKKFKDIIDVVVHIDAEDDSYLHDIDSKLPDRARIEAVINQVVDKNQQDYTLVIHYLDEKLYLDLLSVKALTKKQAAQITQHISQSFAQQSISVAIRVYQHVSGPTEQPI